MHLFYWWKEFFIAGTCVIYVKVSSRTGHPRISWEIRPHGFIEWSAIEKMGLTTIVIKEEACSVSKLVWPHEEKIPAMFVGAARPV